MQHDRHTEPSTRFVHGFAGQKAVPPGDCRIEDLPMQSGIYYPRPVAEPPVSHPTDDELRRFYLDAVARDAPIVGHLLAGFMDRLDTLTLEQAMNLRAIVVVALENLRAIEAGGQNVRPTPTGGIHHVAP